MVVPLVSTKLNLPLLRSNVVARPRLRSLLDRGLETKLTLTTAPEGFGKTTRLADWLKGTARTDLAIAWLSLLRRAIALAEPESLGRPFLDDADDLAPLLRQLGKHRAAPRCVAASPPIRRPCTACSSAFAISECP